MTLQRARIAVKLCDAKRPYAQIKAMLLNGQVPGNYLRDGLDEVDMSLREIELKHVARVFTANAHRTMATSRHLGISRQTLLKKLKEIGVKT